MKEQHPKLTHSGYESIALYDNKNLKWTSNVKFNDEEIIIEGKTLYHIRRKFQFVIEAYIIYKITRGTSEEESN
jgi:hypothetical protein